MSLHGLPFPGPHRTRSSWKESGCGCARGTSRRSYALARSGRPAVSDLPLRESMHRHISAIGDRARAATISRCACRSRSLPAAGDCQPRAGRSALSASSSGPDAFRHRRRLDAPLRARPCGLTSSSSPTCPKTAPLLDLGISTRPNTNRPRRPPAFQGCFPGAVTTTILSKSSPPPSNPERLTCVRGQQPGQEGRLQHRPIDGFNLVSHTLSTAHPSGHRQAVVVRVPAECRRQNGRWRSPSMMVSSPSSATAPGTRQTSSRKSRAV